MIPYGFVDVYGITGEKSQVDFYNKVSGKVIRMEFAGIDCEQAKIDRHRIYHIPLYSYKRK